MSKDWWKNDTVEIPKLVTEASGPKSRIMHEKMAKYMKRLSSQVELFSVCFDQSYFILVK